MRPGTLGNAGYGGRSPVGSARGMSLLAAAIRVDPSVTVATGPVGVSGNAKPGWVR